MKTANPSQVVLAGARQSKTTCLTFTGMLTALASLNDRRLWAGGWYALFVLCIRFALRLSTVFALFLPWFFAMRHRVGFQFSKIFRAVPPKRGVTFNPVLDFDDAPTTFVPWDHGLSLYLDRRREPRANVSPTWFLLLARFGLLSR